MNETNFALPSNQSQVEKLIQQHATLKLSTEDSEAFVDALLNPPKPNDTLKAAGLRYKQIMTQ